jgi:hypothetical protein
MDSLHAQGDGCLHMAFGVVNEEDLLRFDGGPLDGFLKDLGVRFLNPIRRESISSAKRWGMLKRYSESEEDRCWKEDRVSISLSRNG